MRRRGRIVAATTAAGVGVAAWGLQRRRDLHTIHGDPEWAELNRGLDGREQTVVSADGTRLHVEVFGPERAPTIVLAHGWVEAIRLWHNQIRDLSAEFRVVAYDQRGHGRSEAPAMTAYDEKALASDLDAVLLACVPAGERCVIAGHSMGAMAVVAWAGSHAGEVSRRVAAAVLVNTGMHDLLIRTTVLGAQLGSAVNAAVMPPLFTARRSTPSLIDPISLRIVRRIALAPGASLTRVAFSHQMFLTTAPAVRAGFARMFIPLDLRDSVAALSVPTVVLAGAQDRLTPPWHAEQLAESLPQLFEYAVLPDTGHMAPLEAPGDVTQRLRTLAREHASVPEPAAVSAGV